MEVLEELADAKIDQGAGAEAKALYARALTIAKYIKSDRAETILAKNKRANTVIAQQAKLKSLQTKLAADPKNTGVRTKLILLHLVEFDNPAQAAKLLTDDLDETTRTYVSLAARDLADLDEAACLELGRWCSQTLSKKASRAGKPLVLTRAQGYYQRYLELHGTTDIQSTRAQLALMSIEKELARLNALLPGSGKTLMLTLGKDVKMKLVLIPSGKFLMGSPTSEHKRHDREGPQRQVTISKPFYMSTTEVTQAQYLVVLHIFFCLSSRLGTE